MNQKPSLPQLLDVEPPELMQPEPPIKCAECERYMPVHAFDEKSRRCKWCLAKESVQQAMEDQKQAMALMKEIISGDGKPSKAPQIEELCAKAVDYFGGVDGFIQQWGSYFEKVLARHPPSTNVLHHFLGMFKLIKETNQHEHAKEVDMMTAEEIRREQELIVLDMMTRAAVDETQREVFSKVLKLKEAIPDDRQAG